MERRAGNSKLKVDNGAIVSEGTFDAGTFTVTFRRKAIAATGDLGEVQIGRNDEMIRLTFAQAISLATEILRRCQ